MSFEGIYLRASAIMGQVSVEGTGLGGVTVSLQGKGETREMTTNGAGQFMFEDLRRGDYAIGISGYDDDEYGFDVTSKTVMVPYGETENVPFEGTALRTAEVGGTVTVEGMGPLDGVTVSLSGKGDDPDPVVTLGDGRFSFERLHAGDYTISIFGFDTDKYGFDVTSENVTVALKETAAVEFGGIMLRTAAIEGAVTVKGGALPGVTVTVSGGPKDEEHTATTNGAGMYGVGELHAGDYSVAISGYDTREYGFEVTTKPVSVGLRETADVAFDGILLRTAGVSGRVTVDGEAMSGLTVTLSGEEDRTGMTNSGGQYAFSGLAAGDYTIAVSGYDEDEYEFDADMDVELELDEAAIANFAGRSLRTVVIMGTVSAEGDGIAGISVTLTKVLSANSGEVLGATATDADGGYMFDELLAGTYRIDISGFDNEFDFATTFRLGAVDTDETAMWDFPATIIRTASVSGMVTVDGDGMADVMVMLSGDHGTDMDMETASDGGYAFEGLRKGSYTVSITNPDADMYDFPTTSRMVSLAVGQAQGDVSFAGSMLRRASISGQVHVEGTGLEGVMVTLEGDMEGEMMTDGNGEYNFPGLAGGDYSVSIENPDADAYTFADMEIDVDDLGDEEAKIVDFAGEHTATASVSGMLFADEVDNDGMYTDGEPVLPFGEFPLLLQGPGLDQATIGATDSTGMYAFEGLKAGQYNLVVNVTEELEALLASHGYKFTGELINTIDVPAATDMDVNLPFRITRQTIVAGALLATRDSAGSPVNGVRMELYPTAEDAADGTNSLDVATTGTIDGVPGRAAFEFDRAKDKGPGGGDIDYLVYAKVLSSPADLVVHDDANIEIEYEAVDRVSHAPTAAKLINTRVNFQWWVKSNATAKDGNRFLSGWEAENGMVTNSRGLATYTDTVTAAQMAAMIAGTPAVFTVSMDDDQADTVDMGELWTQSRSPNHTHTGLVLPADNKASDNDLTAIHITWKTHSMVLGVYRETDDVDGFTDYQGKVPGGDHRPASSVARDMKIELMARDSRNRLERYEWDHDACWNDDSNDTPDQQPAISIGNGLARVRCLPRDDEFTIKFDLGDDRVEVGAAAELRGYIEVFNEDDLSVGGTYLGAFGDGSGGVPEVRICLSSEGTSDDECATWGYQWMTGTISGNVGTQSGHKVEVEPTTDHVSTGVDSTKSGEEGVYELDELQDGEYDITAYGTRTHKVLGDPTQSVYVYHDETTDDDDTTTKYVGTAGVDTAKWSTRQLGLAIKGYIGNDVNRDKKMRGDETVEGIVVGLTRTGFETMTDTTDDRGFYEFKNLEGGSYRVTPRAGSGYLINRGYRVVRGNRVVDTYWTASADEYPTLVEGDFNMPYWSSIPSRSLSYSSVTVSDDDGDVSARLYNFGLLYTDGEVEGAVNNMSGSARGIDIVFTDEFDDDETDLTTDSRGEFAQDDLAEGEYSAYIEDAGWAVPCMRGSTPDDDGPRNTDGTCSTPAPTTITGSVRGSDDFDDMGSLHVYDESLPASDYASGSVEVRGRSHGEGEHYDTAAEWSTGWSRATDTEETENTSSIGTVTWASESVSFYFGLRNSYLSSDASVEVGKGSKVCASHRCELDYYATDSDDAGTDRENTLTVTVTAANGYDDHEYSLIVMRAAPVGNHLAASGVKTVKSDGSDSTVTATGGAGTSVGDAWSLEAASATVRIDLETLGDPEADNAVCAQSVKVGEYNDPDSLKALKAAEDDICEAARYRLGAATDGTLYEIEVTSEDDETETYYLNVIKPGEKSDDATLASLSLAEASLNETFNSETTAYTADVDHDVGTVSVTFATTDDGATADPGSPHTATLEDAGKDTEITITVTSEDEEEEMVYTITVTRAEEPTEPDPEIVISAGSEMEVEEGSTGNSYMVSLATEPGGGATVTVSMTAGDGLTNLSPASLTFDATNLWSDPQEVTFDAESDDDAEEGASTITHTASSTDTDYDGMVEELDVTITETDTKGVIVTAAGIEIAEGEGNTYMVSLNSQPTGNVAVSISGAPSGVTLNGSVTETLVNFTSDDWSTPKPVAIATAGVEDDDEADHDAFTLTQTAVGGGYGGVAVDDVDVLIVDDEAAAVVISRTRVTTDEGTAFSYTISLTQAPEAGETVEVRLIYSSADFAVAYDGGGNAATFTSSDFDAVTVTVTPVAVTADKVRTLTHTVSSDDQTADDVEPKYTDATASDIAVTVTNND